MPRCIIFANGTLPSLDSAKRLLHPGDFLLAADGGTRHILALGRIPSIIIGDLDSATFDLRPLTDAGTQVIQHPRDKNETDLELALDYAVKNDYREIVIAAAFGNRLDQTLANIALLANPLLAAREVRLDDGVESASFCRAHSEVEGRCGDVVSLIPWGGEVRVVCTEGLRWPLSNETLYAHRTRGLSNEMTGTHARVEIESGLLLVIHRRQS